MGSSIHIATVGGIKIGVHYSWFLVFLVVAWTLAAGLFPEQLPGLGAGTYWVMGFAASLLLFVSVLIHELAHSFVAEARGLKVSGITLFVFGGVSNLGGDPASARDELAIAAVGPLTSLLLGGVLWAVWRAAGAGAGPAQVVLVYLAGVNVLLAVFNMIPGFPLDGGRVLRATVWWFSKSRRTATRVAVWTGQAAALLFVVAGLYIVVFSGALLSGLWLMLIGWFLNNAAGASGRQTEQAELFRGATVREAMNPNPLTVGPDLSIADVVHALVLRRAVRSLPVVEGERLIGMVTLNEIRQVQHERWEETSVRAVMTGLADLRTVGPGDSLETALRLLAEHDVNQLPVVEGGGLAGLLSRSHVMRLLQIRSELGWPAADEAPRRAA